MVVENVAGLSLENDQVILLQCASIYYEETRLCTCSGCILCPMKNSIIILFPDGSEDTVRTRNTLLCRCDDKSSSSVSRQQRVSSGVMEVFRTHILARVRMRHSKVQHILVRLHSKMPSNANRLRWCSWRNSRKCVAYACIL